MLQTIQDYVNARRPAATRMAGYVSGGYLIARYFAQRIQDTQRALLQERLARDNLRRRFDQNRQDISFTVMALLPTLAAHILEGMDVESVTQELQTQTRASKSQINLHASMQSSEPIVVSSNDLNSNSVLNDARSDNGSVSVVSYPGAEDAGPSSELAASHSWVEQLSAPSVTHSPEASSSNGHELLTPSHMGSPKSNIGTEMSDSFFTNSSAVSYGDVMINTQPTTLSSFTRSKAELWKEVKMLTFTRTLTILYSMSLLSLFTHIQLSILGRSKYIQSLLQLARDEKERDRLHSSLSLISLLWNGNLEEQESDDDLQDIPPISEDIERKYLTLSWWILNVGWKDVGERVGRAVEEVFEGVSLKTKLSASDLHRLVGDVRRRVEFEVTFEGRERRINFTSTLLPPTVETLQHVLTQGGIASRLAARHEPMFLQLLSETRTHLSSGSFELVLEMCLDKATEILFASLEKNVFGGASGGWEDPNSALGLTQEPRVRLAGMLPGLARWCHIALEGLPNELIDGLADVREVDAFSAIMYSDYDYLFQ